MKSVKKDYRGGPLHGDCPLYEASPKLKALVFSMRKRIGNQPLKKYAPKREKPVPASWRFYPVGTRPARDGEVLGQRDKDGLAPISIQMAAAFAQKRRPTEPREALAAAA